MFAGPAPGTRGRGRETLRSPTTQKRHGSSVAWVMPMRGPATTGASIHDPVAGVMRIGPVASDAPFSPTHPVPLGWFLKHLIPYFLKMDLTLCC